MVNEEKEKTLFASLGIAYWEWSADSGYYHSTEYEKYAISEMEDEQIWDPSAPYAYVHPDDIPLMKKFMQVYPDDEIKKSAVVRCLMRDGSYRWTEMFSFVEKTEDGELSRLVSAMRDVDKEWIASLSVEQKNEELKHIIDATSGGISTYRLSDVLTLLTMSESLAKRLGYSKEELIAIGETDATLYVHPADRTLLREKAELVIHNKEPQTLAYRILKRDGEYKWFRVSFYDAGESEGYPKLYGVFTDIAEVNAEYEEALNQTNEMVLIADWESQDILYLNQATANAGGRTISDLFGQRCSQVVQHSDEDCSYCFKNELSYDELNNRLITVGKRHYQAKGKRIHWNGREAFVEYVSDVTAQRNMTEKAVFERNLLSSATRVLFPMCIISNLTQNSYSIVEYEDFTTKKAATKGCFDDLIRVGASTIPEEDRDAFVAAFSRKNLLEAYANGVKTVPLIHQQVGDDGLVHWNRTVVVFADQLFDGDLYSITFTDSMDEQKKTEIKLAEALREAEQANKAKTAFLSRVSHDMRTPLNGILGLTTIMKGATTDDGIKHDLTELELSGKYLLNLINDTLDMSRIENGKLTLKPEVCDGRDLLNSTISLLKTNAMPKNITLNITSDNLPFPMLYVDSGRIQQVILNIVGNAIKFSPENGKIDITMRNLSTENGEITDQFIVRDYGIGMSKEFIPHLCEPFSQEDNARTNANQGTGLGMAITKQIVELMGGNIAVESELGKGSCFTITFKTQIATSEQVEQWKRNRVSIDYSDGLSGKRILLCEDHPLNTKIAKRLLEVKGVLVEHAENGAVGIEMVEKSSPYYYDAILMDIRMPVMDGIDAAKGIRSLDREDARHMPIIAMTANAFADDIEQTSNAGMNAHLSKPIDPPILYATLSKLLNANLDARRPIILVVDDIEVNRAVLSEALSHDYEILEAENGVEALEIMEKTKGLNVVITDIHMPEMDGLELIRRIRSAEKYRHIVIIANTQEGDAEQEEDLLALGANDFVYKPSSPKVVAIRVRNALK